MIKVVFLTLVLMARARAALAEVVTLPACGADPLANRSLIQGALRSAQAGDTVVLPSGLCVVSRCEGACPGQERYSALHIEEKNGLLVVGAPEGGSVLKLNPHPTDVHAYCRDAHVLSVHLSRQIRFRGFTIDGSDGDLPHGDVCPTTDPNKVVKIAEHMHGLRVLNATDVTVEDMTFSNVHGDGVNLMGERDRNPPVTEGVTVTRSWFLGNDRSGVAFQRNVRTVSITDNTFRNSGNDQDLDMEPTGTAQDRGPYQVTIQNNLFERTQAKIAVTLGGTGPVPAQGIRFVGNTIRAASTSATPDQGGCIFVYAADDVEMTGNTIVGAAVCPTVQAQRVTRLRVTGNNLTGLAIERQFGVVDVSERVVNWNGDACTEGSEPRPPCRYTVYYPDQLAVSDNRLLQHTTGAPGVRASNSSGLLVSGNTVVGPGGSMESPPRGAVHLRAGLPKPNNGGVYDNARSMWDDWLVHSNRVSAFPYGIVMTAENDAKVAPLRMENNLFGYPLSGDVAGSPVLVLPPGQAVQGNIGALGVCLQRAR